MREHVTYFYSDGFKLDASFYLPDQPSERHDTPLIIACSGFYGLKDIHPARFARALTRKGYVCFSFDYRGFGKSEGNWHNVIIEEQIQDIVNAAIFASTGENKVYAQSGIVLLGWGMGGGLILEAAIEIRGIRALIAVNGFYNAKRVQREVRGSKDWREFRDRIYQERQREARTGEIRKVDPFSVYPLDPLTMQYVDSVLNTYEDFGGPIKFSFAYSLLRFCPEAHLVGLEGKPLFIAHGEYNDLHPPIEAEALYRTYPGDKELYWIPEAGHTEWMLDDNPRFRTMMQRIEAWLRGRVQ